MRRVGRDNIYFCVFDSNRAIRDRRNVCMQAITVDEVFAAVEAVLRR